MVSNINNYQMSHNTRLFKEQLMKKNFIKLLIKNNKINTCTNTSGVKSQKGIQYLVQVI